MDSETPLWKWMVAAGAVIIVCFFLGYFVLGPQARTGGDRVGVAQASGGETTIIPTPPPVIAPAPPRPAATTLESAVDVEETTAQREAQRKKEEAEKKAEAEQEAEADRKKNERDDDESDDRPARSSPSAPPNENEESEDAPPATTLPSEETPVRSAENNDPDALPAAPDVTAPVGTSPPAPSSGGNVGGPLYRVRVGTFDSRTGAQNLSAELNGRGYATRLQPEQVNGRTVYHLQIGAYRDEKRAKEIQKELKTNGYEAAIARG